MHRDGATAGGDVATPTLRQLRRMPEQELIARHDHQAGPVEPGVAYHRAELARRDQERHTRAMLGYTERATRMTRWILWLTVANAAFTLIAAAAAGVALLPRSPFL